MNLPLRTPAILVGFATAIFFSFLWQLAHPWIFPFFFGMPEAVAQGSYEQLLRNKLPALFSYTVFSSMFSYIPAGYISASLAKGEYVRHGVTVGILMAALALIHGLWKGLPSANAVYLLLALHASLAFCLCAFGARVREIQLGHGGQRKYFRSAS